MVYIIYIQWNIIVIKEKAILPSATPQMNPECTMQNEVSQKQKDKIL